MCSIKYIVWKVFNRRIKVDKKVTHKVQSKYVYNAYSVSRIHKHTHTLTHRHGHTHTHITMQITNFNHILESNEENIS